LRHPGETFVQPSTSCFEWVQKRPSAIGLLSISCSIFRLPRLLQQPLNLATVADHTLDFRLNWVTDSLACPFALKTHTQPPPALCTLTKYGVEPSYLPERLVSGRVQRTCLFTCLELFIKMLQQPFNTLRQRQVVNSSPDFQPVSNFLW